MQLTSGELTAAIRAHAKSLSDYWPTASETKAIADRLLVLAGALETAERIEEIERNARIAAQAKGVSAPNGVIARDPEPDMDTSQAQLFQSVPVGEGPVRVVV